MNRTVILFALIPVLIGCNTSIKPEETERPRTIITTDGEVDDMDFYHLIT